MMTTKMTKLFALLMAATLIAPVTTSTAFATTSEGGCSCDDGSSGGEGSGGTGGEGGGGSGGEGGGGNGGGKGSKANNGFGNGSSDGVPGKSNKSDDDR